MCLENPFTHIPLVKEFYYTIIRDVPIYVTCYDYFIPFQQPLLYLSFQGFPEELHWQHIITTLGVQQITMLHRYFNRTVRPMIWRINSYNPDNTSFFPSKF